VIAPLAHVAKRQKQFLSAFKRLPDAGQRTLPCGDDLRHIHDLRVAVNRLILRHLPHLARMSQ
jgi:hypothetical protein